jgi:rhodanese-related sulfurtransferase
VHCNFSYKAAEKFSRLGYPVKVVKGGFKAWEEHRYPVEKTIIEVGKPKNRASL